MHITQSNILIRSRWSLVIAFSLMVVCGVWLTSCQTPPTVPEVLKGIEEAVRQIDQEWNQWKAGCHGDPDCIADANAWHARAMERIDILRTKSLEASWEAARQAERDLEQWFRDTTGHLLNIRGLFPWLQNSSIQVQLSIDEDVAHTNPCTEIASALGVIEEDGHLVNLTNNHHLMKLVSMHPCFQLTATQDGQFVALTTTGKTWTLNGSITVVTDGVSVNVPVAGHIGGLVASNDDTEVRWTIITGHITATMPGGYVTTLNLLEDNNNFLTIGTDGVGQLSVLFDSQYPTVAWGAILPSILQIQLPVAISGGVLGIQVPLTNYASLIPHQPWASSDYNGDSVLNYETDFAAYMNDFNNQDWRADLTDDGFWDQVDIDIWTSRFWDDYDAAQQ